MVSMKPQDVLSITSILRQLRAIKWCGLLWGLETHDGLALHPSLGLN